MKFFLSFFFCKMKLKKKIELILFHLKETQNTDTESTEFAKFVNFIHFIEKSFDYFVKLWKSKEKP